jgi:hypothetical protein
MEPYLYSFFSYLSIYIFVPAHTWTILGSQVYQIKLKQKNKVFISSLMQ